jgi:CDP-paratose 2-epimerase
MEGRTYRVIGYGGKQVRDQLHATDVLTAIEAVFTDPPHPGEVFNLGGGRGTDVSVLEAISLAEEITGLPAKVEHVGERRGDHRWWITDTAKLRARYRWAPTYDVPTILREIYNVNADRWRP